MSTGTFQAQRAYAIRGEPELVADALRRLLDDLRGAGLDIEETAPELDAASVAETCNAFFLGGADKAVIVRDANRFRSKDDLAALVGYLGEPNPQTSLVLVIGGGEGTIDKKLLDAVKKVGAVLDASVPGGKGRGMWLDDRLKEAPLRFDRAASARLADHLGEDLGRLPGILAVLEARHGAGATIGAEDLDPVLGEQGSSAPWDLADAIDRGDTAGALGHLRRALVGRHPFVVFAGLWNHHQRMLRLDGAGVHGEAEAAALLGIKGSTFPARKALSQTKRLGPGGVSRAVALLAQADLDLRGTKEWEPELVLEVLVARLSRLAGPPARR